MDDAKRERMPRFLLVLGLLAGATAAGIGVMGQRTGEELPPDAIASVNGQPILRDAWLRAVAAVSSERSLPLSRDDQRRILDRLIDEELLVQHGVALGLVERDARIRSELVSQVMLAARAMNASEPTPAELQDFHEANRDFFAAPPRLRVALARLEGGVEKPFSPPVPDALLPADKLQHYLGPGLTAKALQLQSGDRIETADAHGQRIVLEVRERMATPPPPLDQVRDQVRAELLRRRDEQAVRTLLAQLRSSEQIQIAADLR